MTGPLITIGITAFNAQETIARAIDSAHSQGWSNKEILVVDDYSSDKTAEIAQQKLKTILSARLIKHTQNTGAAGARNTILKEAKGDFIAFFDDDDESLPSRIETQYKKIITTEEETKSPLVLCYASGERLYPNGYKKSLEAIGSHGPTPLGSGLADRILFFGGPSEWFYGSGTPTCSLMARKAVFERIGGFDESFRRVEDLDFAVRCALENAYFVGCPEKLFIQYATESTDKSYEKNLQAELKLVEKNKKYLESKSRYIYAREWPKIRASHFKKDYLSFILTLGKLWVKHPVAVSRHLIATGPARLRHERKMNQRSQEDSLHILVCCRAIHNMAGGVERMASALMNEMVVRGHKVSLMTLDAEDAQSFYPLNPSIEWHKINIGNPIKKATLKEKIRRALKVRKIVGQAKPDIMIGFQDGPYLSTRVYTLGMGHPIILAERNAPTRYDFINSGKYRYWIYQTFRFAKAITIQCESYRKHYPTYLHKRIVTIPNPVFPADPKNLNRPKTRKILLSIGRLEYQKNYPVLLRAFSKISANFPDWTLRIIGEGADRDTLETLGRELKIKSRLEMPGTTNDPGAEYAAASLFVLPSLWEGFPNVMAEAMAHGIPCTGFEGCAGVSDLIQSGYNGELAKGHNDAGALAQTLENLMKEPGTLDTMGKNATDSIKKYAPAQIYDLWENLFRDTARR
ncbi:MAG: glycosyltransferase [Alphaproteobacteria bacterium]|nr:glycosyltransferase [Alphaproteobacteria bacterium]